MWKRFNNSRGSRPSAPQSEKEKLDDLIYGEPGFEPPSQRKAPPRPPREAIDARAVSRLPYNSNLSAPEPEQDPYARPESSIYSQPSPDPQITRFQNPYSYPEEEVSPPSSPDLERPGGHSNMRRAQQQAGDVSPIDEMPDVSRLGVGRPSSRTNQPSSNIPVLRREKRLQNLALKKEANNGTKGRTAIDPRWDPYTGEITTSDRGKPQSAKPGQFVPPGLRPVHKETGIVLGKESHVTAAAKAPMSFGDRVRKLKSNAIAERPEWKGASGRHAVVPHVKDQPDIPPISIPRKSSKRVASPALSGSDSGSPVTIVRSPYDDETDPASAQPDSSIRTVLDSGRNSPRVVVTEDIPAPLFSPTSASRPASGRSTPKSISKARSPAPTPTPAPAPVSVPAKKPFEREDTLAGIERNFREAFQDLSVPDVDPYEQPPSRFSVTTYAPSATSTPRPSADSDRPTINSIPTPPTSYAFQQPSSIVDRKRPQIGSPKSNVARKAIPPTSPVFINMSSSITRTKRNSTASSMTKNLPMSPAEAASQDLVTQLQAQLDNLAHRRNNITRSIRQMTELMPKDNVILTDQVRRKREDEKRKVELLREEEADVKREEHDIGLRLHRAWKRKDKDAVYEPTGLWVRRITG